ncbi:MAG TPA: VTT domain-containing protein [Vicinamibacterales bacterium]|nr:VTT domain-containing protein [Vicinamibacterales bacterium]
MGSFVDRMRMLAIGLGAPGLFIVAFLDSSFLSLPEIADLLVIYMVTRHKNRLIAYVVATTAGSLLGCLVMYYVGKKGTDAVGRRRVSGPRMERTLKRLRKHGMMAVLVPSILPPPMPFKIFVLLAGAADISVGKFTAAVLVGRGFRYLALGLLAERYGDVAIEYVHAHAVGVSLAAVGVLVAGFGGYLWFIKARDAKRR